MLETHPFVSFVPPNSKYLILGSFAAKPTADGLYTWFYGSKRNYFWPIMREVYGRTLVTDLEKQQLFIDLGIAISDIIYQCERQRGSSLDANLVNIVYNTRTVGKILEENSVQKIFFTSRFVETHFKRHFKKLIVDFPKIELITLPSPSPRYAAITKAEKIRRYRQLVPGLSI